MNSEAQMMSVAIQEKTMRFERGSMAASSPPTSPSAPKLLLFDRERISGRGY
jgi:hypothetical protein